MRLKLRPISLAAAMGLFLSFTAWALCASLCAAGICTEKPKAATAPFCCHALKAKQTAPKCEKCVVQAKIQAQKSTMAKSQTKIALDFPVLLVPPFELAFEEPSYGRGLPALERCNSPPGRKRRPDAPRAPPVS